MKKGIITQSNYIPWKGYFDSIKNVDVFVVYDDMQYTKRDWRNRNLIKTDQGLKWLTIPVEVKGKYFQKINETKIAEKDWSLNHWNIIKQNYKNANYFKDTSEWLEPLYINCNFDYLTDVNMHFINGINDFLGIKTEIRFSSEFNLDEEKTKRLVNICKDLNITDYYSGPAAKSYMQVEEFELENISVKYWDYKGYPVYNQIYGDFEHGVSIIDLLMNEGSNSVSFFKK
jgi:hypothetical protein